MNVKEIREKTAAELNETLDSLKMIHGLFVKVFIVSSPYIVQRYMIFFTVRAQNRTYFNKVKKDLYGGTCDEAWRSP